MTGNEPSLNARAAQAELRRLGRAGDLFATQAEETAGAAPEIEEDWPERWGRRAGRALALLALVAAVIWLASAGG